MQETESREPSTHLRSLALRGIVAAVLAVAVNALVVLAAGSLGIAPGFRALTLPPVGFLSAAGALGATGVYALLVHRMGRPDRTFVRVAAVALVVSFVPDLALLAFDPAATVAGVVVLMVMHVVVAAIAVGVLTAGGAGVAGSGGEEPRAAA